MRMLLIYFEVFFSVFWGIYVLPNEDSYQGKDKQDEVICSCNRMSDSLALVELYNNTSGNEWSYINDTYDNRIEAGWYPIPNAGNPWDFNMPIDQWHGVSLNDEGCVELLVLNDNGLVGPMIDLNLPQLQFLYCENNQLTNSIPDFSNLMNLQLFDCSRNDFELLSDFSNLPELKYFYCLSNELTGSIPDFTNSPNLQFFYCNGNQLTNSIPDFSNLMNLKVFECSSNELTGSIPNFSNLPNLESFNCTFNQIGGSLPDFQNLEKLRYFSCHQNQIGGAIPNFSNLDSLEYFSCAVNNLTGSLPNFSNLLNLKNLECSRNNITGSIPDFSNLLNLQSFKCAKNNLTGSIPDFTNLETLSFFKCDNNNLSGGIPNFSNLPNLISFYCNNNILNEEIPDLSNHCPSLGIFNLENNQLSFEDIVINFQENSNLITINSNSTNSMIYYPQDSVFVDTTLTVNNGDNIQLDMVFDELILDNIYTWYKDGMIYKTVIGNNDFQLNNVTIDSSGIYHCVITNDRAPELTLFSRSITIDVVNNVCDQTSDSLVLVALYNATNGSNWTNTWDLTQSMGTWFGVELNIDGCVTCLDLDGNDNCTPINAGGNNLTGTIPIELGQLNNLHSLYISYNPLSENIPPELGELSNLQNLFLVDNNFTGSIPIALGELDNLENLNLSRNSLSGSIPPEIGQLSKLKVLDLYFNSLTGNIPIELGLLNKLEYLSLSLNSITGSIPPELGQLDSLKSLFIVSNLLTGNIPPELGQLNKLEELQLNNNSLTGSIPLELGQLGMLERLGCNENLLTGNIPPELGQLNMLKSLHLHSNSLTGNVPPELGQLSELEYLYLNNNSLSGTIPAELGQLNSLYSIYLFNNLLTGEIPSELGQLTNLSSINFKDNGLSGCFPSELDAHCGINYDYSNNPQLPWQGNFLNFCDGLVQTGASCDDGDLNTIDDIIQADCVCRGTDVNSCRYQDSLVLVELYVSTDSANWINKWDLTQAMDTWYGITINNDGCVTCLDLDGATNCSNNTNVGNGLMGNIPSEIGNLSYLEYLNVTNNQLTGTIPIELLYLVNLKHLYIDDNELTGTIPIEIDNLSNLQSLALDNNQLTGNIPIQIGNLSYLEELYLDNNQLTGNIPEEVGNLSNLRELYLFNNQLTGNIPEEIGNLNNINKFYLFNNALEGCFSDSLTNICSLGFTDSSFFYLHGYNLTNNPLLPWEGNFQNFCDDLPQIGANCDDGDPNTIGDVIQDNCTCSGELITNTCNYQDSLVLVELYNATNGVNWTDNTNWLVPGQPIGTWFGVTTNADGCVIILGLNNNSLDGSIPPEIGELINLSQLYLNSNSLEGSIPSELGQLSGLAFLYLNNNFLMGNIPSELGQLGNLIWLQLDNNELSGCFPQELIEHCGIMFEAEFYYNTALPWQGDFRNFCDGLPQIGVNCDDGDPNTIDDIIQNDCVCRGTDINSCSYQDSLVLVELYNTNNGTNWTNSLNWLVPSQPISTWYGVMTNTEGCVAELNLSDNLLSGSITSEIGNLNNLTYLDLSQNAIGILPPELGNLSNLVHLNLSFNFIGIIPPELGNLSNLEYLNFAGNSLFWEANLNLSDLENLNKLTYLNLAANNTGGDILSELVNFSNLTHLILSSNILSGNIPPELANLSNLTVLHLDDNYLTGTIPPELGNLGNLTSLLLDINFLSGTIPFELGNLNNLTQLHLFGNSLTGTIPPELGNLNSLTSIYLDDNQLEGCFPNELNIFCSLGFSTDFNSDGYNFFDNPALPLGGDFESYCDNVSQIAVSCDDGDPNTINDIIQMDCICMGVDPNSCRYQDSLVLVELYYSTNGDNWTNNNNWLVFGQPLDTWYGIETDAEGCVTCIDLDGSGQCIVTTNSSGNNLIGNIPPELGQLTRLEDLIFAYNSLSGSIPPELGLLDNLSRLDLRSNSLTGEIPIELSQLNNLSILILSSNFLSGGIPSELSQLSNLSVLSLFSNSLTDTIPKEIGELNNLTSLSLYSNSLSGKIPPELGQLTGLNSLDLNFNLLTGNIPPELGQLNILQRLRLNGNQLSGCFPAELEIHCDIQYNFYNNPMLPWQGNFLNFCNGMSQIGASCDDENDTTINDIIQNDCSCRGINECVINDSIALVSLYNATNGPIWTTPWDLTEPMSTWSGVYQNTEGCVDSLILGSRNLDGNLPDLDLPNLIFFRCTDNELTGSIPDFSYLVDLTYFDCSVNDLTGEIPNFSSLENLEYFYCVNNKLSGSIPDFSSLPNLKDFNCRVNELEGEIPNFTNIPNLLKLQCGRNQLTGEIPDFSNLNELTILDCTYNNLEGTIPTFSNLPNLEQFQIHNNELTEVIPDLSLSCPLLISFYFENNKLTFEDILPNIDANELLTTINDAPFAGDSVRYNPQSLVYVDTTVMITSGESIGLDMGFDEFISNNVYTWYKDGEYNKTVIGNNDFTLSGVTPDSSGVYNCIVTNVGAPDLVLQSRNIEVVIECIGQSILLEETTCSTQPYFFDGNLIDTTGSYFDTLSTLYGCDSIIQLDLTVIPLIATNLVETVCEGENFIIGNTAYNTNGFHSLTLMSDLNCDSIVNLDLTVIPSSTFTFSDTFCEGESYSIIDTLITDGGTYTFVLEDENYLGCDSIITLSLSMNTNSSVVINDEFCNGETYYIADTSFSEAGQHTILLENASSLFCDSIIILNLIGNDSDAFSIDTLVCEGENIVVGTSIYSETGDYLDSLVNMNGCDSIVQLTLEVIPSSITYIDTLICEGDTIFINDLPFFNETTLEEITLSTLSPGNCDSTIVLSINILDEVAIVGDDMVVCNEDIELNANNVASTIGEWSSSSNAVIIEPEMSITTMMELDTGLNVFIWTLTSEVCPNYYSSDTIEVVFDALPPIAIEDNAFTEANIPLENFDLLLNDLIDNWEGLEFHIIEETANGTISIHNSRKITYTPNDGFTGIDSLRYQICNPACDLCSEANAFIIIRSLSDEMNTAISPNGDGKNDFFEIPNILDYPNNSLIIINRIKSTVYKAAPYNNEWNGQNMQGNPLPEGPYFYFLKLNQGENKIIFGSIDVKRE